MFRITLSQVAFPEGVASHQSGLTKGVPLFQLPARKLTRKVPLDNQFNCSIAEFFGDHLANNGTETNEFPFQFHDHLL